MQRLARVIPSDRALATVLGTDNHAVAGWRNGTRRMRKGSAVVVSCMDALVDHLRAVGIDEGDVEYVVSSPWPALDQKLPAEALKDGDVETVLDAAVRVYGELLRDENRSILPERVRAADESDYMDEEEPMMAKERQSTLSDRLAQVRTHRPARTPEIARFEPYDVDRQFALGRIGNVRESAKRPTASGRVVGMTSDEPIRW